MASKAEMEKELELERDELWLDEMEIDTLRGGSRHRKTRVEDEMEVESIQSRIQERQARIEELETQLAEAT